MKTLSEKIAVMQAAERGEAIEARTDASEYWQPVSVEGNPMWAWDRFDYRIAPKKPREFTIALHEGKVVGVGGVERGDYVVIDSPKSLIGVTTIRVREVVEEPKVAIARANHIEPLTRFGQFGREWSHDGGTTWSTSWMRK